MSECCETDSSDSRTPKKYRCPINRKEYSSVGIKTILHHLATPWRRDPGSQAWYFCTDPNCDVVYFGLDDSVILKSELRTVVGVKDKSDERIVCYCFGVTCAAAKENPAIYDYVKEQTRQSLCSCETSNPSGRCCLKDFPQQ